MRFLAAMALLVFTALPALAQEDHQALAEHAVRSAYEQQIATSIMDTYWPVATELIKLRVPGLTEVQLFQYKGKTGNFANETAHAALVPLVDLFAKGFTDEELQAVIAFYESPAGEKFNGAQPVILSVMAGAVGDGLKAEIGSFQAKIDAMLTADGY
jgi:hypothetical protein